MDYKLPEILDEGAYIKSLHPDRIYKYRDDIRSHYEAVLRIMDDALENQEQHECTVCEAWDSGYKSIPSDWAYVSNTALLCGDCLGRWFYKFGDLPQLSKEREL